MSFAKQTPPQLPVPVWWILWTGITGGLVLVYVLLGHTAAPVVAELPAFLPYFIATPLLLSCVVRWLVLPRLTSRLKAFPIFIIGLALAEGSGMLGIFLVGMIVVSGVSQRVRKALRPGAPMLSAADTRIEKRTALTAPRRA